MIGGLAEVLNQHRYVARTQVDTSGCRGCRWTFKWANTETARTAHTAHLADVVTAHLAARLEGCREEVAGLVRAEVRWPGPQSQRLGDHVLAVVREALGLPPETQGAALRASDGADGPEGHREATRAGDGL